MENGAEFKFKFLLSTQTQNSPPLVRSAVDNSEQGSQSG
jgi:hypothetical protein